MPHHIPWYAPDSEVEREQRRQRAAEARAEQAELELAMRYASPETTPKPRGPVLFQISFGTSVTCLVHRLGDEVTLLYLGDGISEVRFNISAPELKARLGEKWKDL